MATLLINLLLIILAEFAFFAVIRYSFLLFITIWVNNNMGKEYLYQIDTETYALLTDDDYLGAVKYGLTIPIKNFKNLANVIKAMKEDKVTTYPEWVYKAKNIHNAKELASEAIVRNDIVTAFVVLYTAWKGEQLEMPEITEKICNIILENKEICSDISKALLEDQEEYNAFLMFMQEAIREADESISKEKAEELILFFNGTLLNEVVNKDWLTDEEIVDIDNNVDVVRDRFKQSGCRRTLDAVLQSVKTNSAVLGLIVVYADWVEEDKVLLNNELTDAVVEALRSSNGLYKTVFTKERFEEFANVLITNLESRNRFDVVAEIAEMCK